MRQSIRVPFPKYPPKWLKRYLRIHLENWGNSTTVQPWHTPRYSVNWKGMKSVSYLHLLHWIKWKYSALTESLGNTRLHIFLSRVSGVCPVCHYCIINYCGIVEPRSVSTAVSAKYPTFFFFWMDQNKSCAGWFKPFWKELYVMSFHHWMAYFCAACTPQQTGSLHVLSGPCRSIH